MPCVFRPGPNNDTSGFIRRSFTLFRAGEIVVSPIPPISGVMFASPMLSVGTFQIALSYPS